MAKARILKPGFERERERELVFKIPDGKARGCLKAWVQDSLKIGVTSSEFRAWILTLGLKISGVEKLGSTSVFLLSGFHWGGLGTGSMFFFLANSIG